MNTQVADMREEAHDCTDNAIVDDRYSDANKSIHEWRICILDFIVEHFVFDQIEGAMIWRVFRFCQQKTTIGVIYF
jgi:hypothetical protein